MKAQIKLALCTFLLLVVLPNGLSIKCFDCRSNLDPKCEDPFDNSTIPITNCKLVKGYLDSSEISMCRKIRQKVNGQIEIIRGCAWKRQEDRTSICPPFNNGPNVETSFCETCDFADGCNGAATIGKTLVLIIAPLGLLFK